MSRPIDADHLDQRIYNEIPLKVFGTVKRMAVVREIGSIGKWVLENYPIYKYRCTNCDAYHRACYNYCPTCGAYMESAEHD